MAVVTGDSRRLRLSDLLRTLRGPRRLYVSLPGDSEHAPLPTGLQARRIKSLPRTRSGGGELLIVAASKDARTALSACRKRGAIECLFGDARTQGLNLEDTRLTIARQLSLMRAIVAIAIAWSSSTAAIIVGCRAMPRKAHGHLAKSWFRTGFDALRNRLRHEPDRAIRPWPRKPPTKPKGDGGVQCGACSSHTAITLDS